MTIEFHCPHCDIFLCVDDDKAGLTDECPSCETPITVPQPGYHPSTRSVEPDVDRYPPEPIEPRGRQPLPPRYAGPHAYVPHSGMATASLVLGIVGLCLFCLSCISLPCSILSLIFGVMALKSTSSGQMRGQGTAIAGLVCAILALALSGMFLPYFIKIFD